MVTYQKQSKTSPKQATRPTDRRPMTRSPQLHTKPRRPSPQRGISVSEQIAEMLGETTRQARWQIGNMLQCHGYAVVRGLLQETLQVVQSGGMRTSAGDRARTTGGIFFYLAKERHGKEYRAFMQARRQAKKKVQEVKG